MSKKDFLETIEERKTIRSFSQQEVPNELISKILRIATFAPSSCNQQLWNFIVIKNKDTKERLIKEAASNTLFRRAPFIIAITYDGWNKKEAIQGGSLALGNILLAATYYGVGACSMNSYGADSKIRKILKIPKKETICCFVAIGYPDERAQEAPKVPRRSVEESMHWESFQNKQSPPFTYNPNDWTIENLRDHQKHYCRKTFLGKEMDIMSEYERILVNRTLKNIKGHIADIFSYDGAYLREFPNIPITTIDLNEETKSYTEASVGLYAPDRKSSTTFDVYNENNDSLFQSNIKTATMIYKIERIPNKLRNKIFLQTNKSLSDNGKFIIIARKKNIFLSLFFLTIKTVFGKDLRKTGIYNFFGPYKPISIKETVHELKSAGFKNITWSGYFTVPSFYEQILQMLFQYIKSEGSSYLHREKSSNILTKVLSKIIKIQGFKRFGSLGSVAVITAQK